MANDDETLTFRLRAVAENMAAFNKVARGTDDLNASMIKSQKTVEKLTASNQKLNSARDKEADAAGKVRIAEQKLNEVRGKTGAKMSQIAAAEERVATARRNSSRATNEANRLEADFKKLAEGALGKIAEDAGRDSGKRFHLGWKRSKPLQNIADDAQKSSKIIGSTFGSGILSGLQAALKSPAGPGILAGLIAAVAIAAPAIGAVLAGGLVLGFGAGIATLGIVFAAKSKAVREAWRTTVGQMGADMRGIAKPFEGVLIHIANTMKTEFGKLAPVLKTVFAVSAGPVQRFVDQAIGALDRFKPALLPITRAFDALLASLGPALQDAVGDIADGMIMLSDSISRNPNGLPDFIRGIGDLTKDLLGIITVLNDADGAFRDLTGGTSAVTVTMTTLKYVMDGLLGPLVLSARYVIGLKDAVNALDGVLDPIGANFHHTATSAEEAATATGYWTQGMSKAQLAAMGITSATKGVTSAAKGAKPSLDELRKITAQNAANAAAAKQKFEDLITSMFRLQNQALSLSHAQLGMKQAISDATQSLKDNGKTLNTNTIKGQANYSSLLRIADAANQQTEQTKRSGASMVTVNGVAARASASFVTMAHKMGLTVPQAKAMAKQLIAIPNVTRTAKLNADKRQLETKLAAAKRELANKDLTRERKAKLNADITKLTAQLKKAQDKINALHGKVVVIKYTAAGVISTSSGSSIGTRTQKGGDLLASGGKLHGPGTPTSDSIPLWGSRDEWMINAQSSRKYGDKKMRSVNDGTAEIIPGYATGGAIDIHSRGIFKSVASMRRVLDKAMGGRALSWARSQVGKPYVWGGVGPGGYDCSGFMSAIANVIRGANPHRRLFATGSLPGGLFQKGSGRFNIGWFKGNPGHTAGTLAGVNVESRGGRGVVVGAGARGASNKLFTSGVWHLKGYAGGGKVRAGDPPYDGFGEWLENLKSYARGTPYVPQDGPAYLHRGERVTPAGQNGPTTVVLRLETDGSPYMEFLIREFRKYVNVRGGDVQLVLGGGRRGG